MSNDDIRGKLATACRIIAAGGHEDFIWGHMSARDPEMPGRFWMKGAGLGLLEAGPEDMVLLDLDGEQHAGDRQHHNEWPIHSEIFRLRPDVQAVIHTHPFYATLVASLDAPLIPAVGWASLVGIEPIPRYDKTSALIDTKELGKEVAQAMGRSPLLLLRNHGVVIADRSIELATFMAIRLEKIAQAQIMAMATGAKALPASDEESLSRLDALTRRPQWVWDYLARNAQGHEHH